MPKDTLPDQSLSVLSYLSGGVAPACFAVYYFSVCRTKCQLLAAWIFIEILDAEGF